MMDISTPRSSKPPSRLMPLPYMMSNSACLNGGATLFLTTLTRVRLPTMSVPSLSVSMRRKSGRAQAQDFKPLPPVGGCGGADHGVELQRLATGGGLGRAEHGADLLAQLVDEDHRRAGVAERTGHLAQRLAHQPGLQADVAVAHLALDLGARHQGGDRVDDDQVEG